MNETPYSRLDQLRQTAEDLTRPEDERQTARLRMAFWEARYQPVRHSDLPADLFLAMWANLILNSSASQLRLPARRILKDLRRFFDSPKLIAAMTAAGDRAAVLLDEELLDSVRFYFATCRTDTNYGSMLFNVIKLKEGQIAAKTATNAAEGILRPLAMIEDAPHRASLIKAACLAYPEVFPEYAGLLDEKIRELTPEIVARIAQTRE